MSFFNKSFHGVGIDEGLKILDEVRNEFNIPVTADFSNAEWGKETGEVIWFKYLPTYVDKLLYQATKTNKPINLKKGQFMSPWNIRNSVKT